jgi:hypothetical protein
MKKNIMLTGPQFVSSLYLRLDILEIKLRNISPLVIDDYNDSDPSEILLSAAACTRCTLCLFTQQ